jgi:hypothetical protein
LLLFIEFAFFYAGFWLGRVYEIKRFKDLR